MNLNWITESKSFEDLITVEDDYVVHSRGFTVGNDIWLDEYSLHLEHHRWWNDAIRHHYDYPKWEPRTSWTYYNATEVDETCLYWSINGNSMFVLQYPRFNQITEEHSDMLLALFEELSIPDDYPLRLECAGETEKTNSHTKALLESVPKTDMEVGEFNGIEKLK